MQLLLSWLVWEGTIIIIIIIIIIIVVSKFQPLIVYISAHVTTVLIYDEREGW
jgi:hypothetical protein